MPPTAERSHTMAIHASINASLGMACCVRWASISTSPFQNRNFGFSTPKVINLGFLLQGGESTTKDRVNPEKVTALGPSCASSISMRQSGVLQCTLPKQRAGLEKSMHPIHNLLKLSMGCFAVVLGPFCGCPKFGFLICLFFFSFSDSFLLFVCF